MIIGSNIIAVSMLFYGLIFSACKKNSTDNPASSRTVKYELSGTYSGTLIVGHTNETGTTQVLDNIRLPWSKEITVQGDVIAIGLGGNSETGGPGGAGQTLTGKISVGGVVKKTTTVNTTTTGYVSLSGLQYIF